jgi:phage terminase large subunit-like protein
MDMTAIVKLVHCNSPRNPYIKNGTVLFPGTGCEQFLAQLFCFSVEAHDDLVDPLAYLILGLVKQGLELSQICWIEA